jgi:hypothetical protein
MFDIELGLDVELAEGTPSPESIAMLLAVDPASLPRAAAVAAAIGVERAKRLLDAVGLRFQARAAGLQPLLRDVDEAAQEISAALGMHPVTATMRVSMARSVVRRLPGTLKALEAAELSLRQVEAVERATRSLDAAAARAVEAAAVPGDPRRLNQRLLREISRIAPGQAKKQTEQKRTERSVENWSDPAEGIAGFAVQGPLDQVAQIKAAIDAEARTRTAGECRPIAARRFDVLLGWARTKLGLDRPPGPGTTRARSAPARIPVSVTVPLATLLHLSEAPGELDGYGPIPADVARELAADGEWRRWLLDTDGRLTDIGSRTYRPSARLDRYVRGRDRTCRFPTCTQPAARCDLDHTIAFHTDHGDTTADNLVTLCRHHHRLKHETDWTYTQKANGDVHWTAPSGRTYPTPAEHHTDDQALNAFYANRHHNDRKKRERQNSQPKKEYGPAYLGTPPF